MYHGSLATVGPWEALVTFQQFLILSDRLGTVDMTAEVIARITTVPLEIITKGIAVLHALLVRAEPLLVMHAGTPENVAAEANPFAPVLDREEHVAVRRAERARWRD